LDEEILGSLLRLAGNPRQHAAFFHWHERSADGKGMVELHIVCELLRSMAAAGKLEFRQARRSTDQWPDCWALNASSVEVPVEVTELVDFDALPAGPARPWSASEIRERIQARITEKSLRSANPAAAPASVLVLHTDEPHLEPANVASACSALPSGFESGTIARAFLLFSYRSGRYPYLELSIARPA